MEAYHCIVQNNFPSPPQLALLSISNFDGPKYWSSLEIKLLHGEKNGGGIKKSSLVLKVWVCFVSVFLRVFSLAPVTYLSGCIAVV